MRRPVPSAARFLAEHYAPQRPVIVTGGLARTPALTRWTFEQLTSAHGALEVEIQDGRDAEPDVYQREFDRFCRRTTLGELIARIAARPSSNDFYLTAKNRLLAQPGAAVLLADLEPLPEFLVPPRSDLDAAVWIGPAGTRTPLHHEGCNAAIAQLRGRKRFHLVPAACAPLVGNHESRFADLDATALDPAQARVFEVTLEPGELLFILVGWWHQVEALEPSISRVLRALRTRTAIRGTRIRGR
ncbi:MAG: cupin-like domain-containing protein [Deltaproteobacteria bacterium]|nr:cupin-like domain-containing protein [Deltaproteobacteria bacterium]